MGNLEKFSIDHLIVVSNKSFNLVNSWLQATGVLNVLDSKNIKITPVHISCPSLIVLKHHLKRLNVNRRTMIVFALDEDLPTFMSFKQFNSLSRENIQQHLIDQQSLAEPAMKTCYGYDLFILAKQALIDLQSDFDKALSKAENSKNQKKRKAEKKQVGFKEVIFDPVLIGVSSDSVTDVFAQIFLDNGLHAVYDNISSQPSLAGKRLLEDLPIIINKKRRDLIKKDFNLNSQEADEMIDALNNLSLHKRCNNKADFDDVPSI